MVDAQAQNLKHGVRSRLQPHRLIASWTERWHSVVQGTLQWAGIDDAAGVFTTLSLRCIESLKFNDGTADKVVIVDLSFGLKQLLLCFRAFVKVKLDGGTSVYEDWQNLVTKDDFVSFRLAGCDPDHVEPDPNVKPVIVTSSGQAGDNAPFPNRPRDLVFEFKKGKKRDPASFAALKDNKQWDSVHRTLKAQTSYQDVEEILLFNEKQKCACSVLERILQADEGKTVVRSHDGDRNVQEICAEFLQAMTPSAEALMDSSVLLSHLAKTKISDGTWKGTLKNFVLHGVDELQMCHQLIQVTDRPSENTQHVLLQSEVVGLDALRQAQTMHSTA